MTIYSWSCRGYMAPEYLALGQLTEKADVYSFGVLLLEMATGRQNNRSKESDDSDSLVTVAGTAEQLFDPNLVLQEDHNSEVKDEILRVVHIGLLCTQEVPSLRPIMSKTLQMLTKKEENLIAPSNPPFLDKNTMELHDTNGDHENAEKIPNTACLQHSLFANNLVCLIPMTLKVADKASNPLLFEMHTSDKRSFKAKCPIRLREANNAYYTVP
ncbi:hypothetical protein ACSQ67_003035 [Phaseolus vulgaris]